MFTAISDHIYLSIINLTICACNCSISPLNFKNWRSPVLVRKYGYK